MDGKFVVGEPLTQYLIKYIYTRLKLRNNCIIDRMIKNLFVKTYLTHILQKITLQKVNCKSYLYFEKRISNYLSMMQNLKINPQ